MLAVGLAELSAQGLRASAATISSAALIMVAVFGVFASTGTPSIKEIGLGLAVAIALDATLVRLIPGAGHDGDHGPLELVAAEAAPRLLPRRTSSGPRHGHRGCLRRPAHVWRRTRGVLRPTS